MCHSLQPNPPYLSLSLSPLASWLLVRTMSTQVQSQHHLCASNTLSSTPLWAGSDTVCQRLAVPEYPQEAREFTCHSLQQLSRQLESDTNFVKRTRHYRRQLCGDDCSSHDAETALHPPLTYCVAALLLLLLFFRFGQELLLTLYS